MSYLVRDERRSYGRNNRSFFILRGQRETAMAVAPETLPSLAVRMCCPQSNRSDMGLRF